MKARMFLTLLSAILVASVATAGPGHRGRGSQFWDGLAADFDQNQDGQITLEEMSGAEATFEHLDRNADGVVSEADFGRGHGMRGRRMGGPRAGRMGGGFLAHLADGDGDGAVTSAELDAFLAGLDADGDGLIGEEEIRAALERDGFPGRGPRGDRPRTDRPFDVDGDGEVEVEDFRAIFADLDENGDGVLEGDELPSFGHPMRGPRGAGGGGPLARRADADDDGEISSAEWRAFVAGLDADGDATIGWDEWHAAGPADREPRPERFEMILRFFDENDNGVLETSDFDALFAELDADGDGTIEADELPRPHFRHRRR